MKRSPVTLRGDGAFRFCGPPLSAEAWPSRARAHEALQCGFCTPGMVMSCAALLARNPKPTLEDVRDATSGNLCRCGTYPKVFAATLAAAKGGRKEG